MSDSDPLLVAGDVSHVKTYTKTLSYPSNLFHEKIHISYDYALSPDAL